MDVPSRKPGILLRQFARRKLHRQHIVVSHEPSVEGSQFDAVPWSADSRPTHR